MEDYMPGNNAIDGIKACVFDAYGTLFDVHSAVGNPTAQFPQRFDNLFIHSI
jgi:2-haloacid dehalogenase